MSKKFLILSFYFKPDLCAGSFRTTALVEAFKNKINSEDRIDIITTMPNRYNTFRKKAKRVEKLTNNITVYRIPIPLHKSGLLDQIKSFSTYFFKTLMIVRKHDYNFVFATSSRLFTAFLGMLCAKLKKTILYLDIRDIFTDTMKDLLKGTIIGFIVLPVLKIIEKITFSSSVHINLVSKGFHSYFKKKYYKSYSFYTNGIDTDFFPYDYSKNRMTNKKIITYAGNIGEGQGLHKIIPSAKKLEDKFDFWIIGDGGAKQKLVETIEKYDITNTTLYTPVDRTELKELYKKSDYLLLHLNDCDAFKKVLPSKIFEYSVTEKPIIGGVTGYAAEFLEKNVPNVILFEPGDREMFENNLLDYKYKIASRKKFIENSKRTTIMSEMVDNIISIFKKHQ